jgi:hypothetical protein
MEFSFLQTSYSIFNECFSSEILEKKNFILMVTRPFSCIVHTDIFGITYDVCCRFYHGPI